MTSLFAVALVAGVPLGSPVFGLLSDLLGPREAMGAVGAGVALFAWGAGRALTRLESRTTREAQA